MNNTELSAQQRDLVATAASWHLIARLFERPRAGWQEDIRGLARECSDAALASAAQQGLAEADESVFLALLGPGGLVSAREVAHRGAMAQPGALLAQLAAFYEAFAYQPQTEEALDHISVEAGFLSYLVLKEAFAVAREQPEEAELAGQAAAHLLAEHLRHIAQPLADSLRAAASETYLAQVAECLLQRTGPRPPGARLPIFTEASDEPFCCSGDVDQTLQ